MSTMLKLSCTALVGCSALAVDSKPESPKLDLETGIQYFFDDEAGLSAVLGQEAQINLKDYPEPSLEEMQ